MKHYHVTAITWTGLKFETDIRTDTRDDAKRLCENYFTTKAIKSWKIEEVK